MTHSPEGETPEVLGNTVADYLRACNAQLASMPLGPERDDYGRRARNELDHLWEEEEMMGERCIVSGSAVYPKRVVKEGEEIDESDVLQDGAADYQIVCEQTTLEGYSLGFEYIKILESVPPMINYVFQLQYVASTGNPWIKRTAEICAYFDQRDCRILPLSMIDETYNLEATDELEEVREALGVQETPEPVVEHDEICDVLSRRSDGLRDVLHSKKFRRLPHKMQVSLVDLVIGATEAETGVVGASVLVDPEFAYLTQPNNEEAAGVLYQRIGLEGAVLSGVCKALTVLGRERLSTTAIRRSADLRAKYTGLVLSLETSEVTMLPNAGRVITPGDIVHVPISGQEFQAIFSPKPGAELD